MFWNKAHNCCLYWDWSKKTVSCICPVLKAIGVRITSHGNEVLPQDTTHLIQRPCYQRGSPWQDPAGNWTTWRPDDHKETQTAVVWSCLPFTVQLFLWGFFLCMSLRVCSGFVVAVVYLVMFYVFLPFVTMTAREKDPKRFLLLWMSHPDTTIEPI